MKLTDHTVACNSLTNFEYNGKEGSANGNYGNMLKFVFEKVVRLTDHFTTAYTTGWKL